MNFFTSHPQRRPPLLPPVLALRLLETGRAHDERSQERVVHTPVVHDVPSNFFPHILEGHFCQIGRKDVEHDLTVALSDLVSWSERWWKRGPK